MGFGCSHTAILALFWQTLFIANIPNPAHGLVLRADYDHGEIITVAHKRADDTQTGEDWIDLPGKPGFRLHPNCKGYMDSGSSSSSSSSSDSDAISEATFSWFSTTLSNVLHINKAAQGAIPTLNGILDGPEAGDSDGSDGTDLTDSQKAQIELYGKMYGEVDLDDEASVKRAKDRVAKLGDFVDEFVEGLDSNTFKSDIICDHTLWKTVKHDGKDVFTLENEPDCPYFRQRGTQSDPCTNASNDEKTVMGFSAKTKDNSRNYLTICPKAWGSFTSSNAYGDSIIDWNQKGLGAGFGSGGMEGKSLESIVRVSPEGLFTHELSHSQSKFGENGRMLDIKLKGGTMKSAYGWENVVQLGEQDKNEGDVSKVEALKNAETYEFWVGGSYLSVCNWSTGVCFDPADDSDCSIDMS